MQYFYIKTIDGTVYGSFDTKSEALRYVNHAGFTCDWELIEGEVRNADIDEYDEGGIDPDHWNIDN